MQSLFTNQTAIIGLFSVINRYVGNSDAWRVSGLSGTGDPQHRRRPRDDADALGMPPPPKMGGLPVTNIRNTTSPQSRGWLKPQSRCLFPFNSFAEYAPDCNPETKKKDVVWFALNDERPLAAFAGIWTEFKGDRGTRSKPLPGPHLIYASRPPRRSNCRADPS